MVSGFSCPSIEPVLSDEIDLRHRHRGRRHAERLAEQKPFRPAGHAQLHAAEIGRPFHVALGAQIELARAEIGGRQDDDAHLVGDVLPVALADRPAHHLGGVIPVAEQEGAVEEAPFGNLLRDLEGRHRAHFEVAALDRRDFGALAEQARARMQLDVELIGRGLVDLLLEALQRLGQEVRRRRGGGEAQLDFLRGGGACRHARLAAMPSPVRRKMLHDTPQWN